MSLYLSRSKKKTYHGIDNSNKSTNVTSTHYAHLSEIDRLTQVHADDKKYIIQTVHSFRPYSRAGELVLVYDLTKIIGNLI